MRIFPKLRQAGSFVAVAHHLVGDLLDLREAGVVAVERCSSNPPAVPRPRIAGGGNAKIIASGIGWTLSISVGKIASWVCPGSPVRRPGVKVR